ncbi:MAG: DUF4136 domain-containing protein [Bacteroidota bacterium]
MKIALITLAFFMVGCINMKNNPTVNYKITDELLEAQTYLILSSGEVNEPTRYAIESSIRSRFDALGYESGFATSELIILYTVYEKDFNLVTWSQTNMNLYEEGGLPAPRANKRKLKAGTLYISIFDRVNQEVVWRGYTNNRSNNRTNNPLSTKANVYRLLDEFTVIAKQKQFASKPVHASKSKI